MVMRWRSIKTQVTAEGRMQSCENTSWYLQRRIAQGAVTGKRFYLLITLSAKKTHCRWGWIFSMFLYLSLFVWFRKVQQILQKIPIGIFYINKKTKDGPTGHDTKVLPENTRSQVHNTQHSNEHETIIEEYISD